MAVRQLPGASSKCAFGRGGLFVTAILIRPAVAAQRKEADAKERKFKAVGQATVLVRIYCAAISVKPRGAIATSLLAPLPNLLPIRLTGSFRGQTRPGVNPT